MLSEYGYVSLSPIYCIVEKANERHVHQSVVITAVSWDISWSVPFFSGL